MVTFPGLGSIHNSKNCTEPRFPLVALGNWGLSVLQTGLGSLQKKKLIWTCFPNVTKLGTPKSTRLGVPQTGTHSLLSSRISSGKPVILALLTWLTAVLDTNHYWTISQIQTWHATSKIKVDNFKRSPVNKNIRLPDVYRTEVRQQLCQLRQATNI